MTGTGPMWSSGRRWSPVDAAGAGRLGLPHAGDVAGGTATEPGTTPAVGGQTGAKANSPARTPAAKARHSASV